MTYSSYILNDFGGGLNLSTKADSVADNECIDCKNVVFTERGAVRQRDGYDNFTSSALSAEGGALAPFYTTSGTRQLVVSASANLYALNTSGGLIAAQAKGVSGGSYSSLVRYGSTSTEVMYVGSTGNTLYKWDGSAWSLVANTPKATALCVTAASNRLVATGFSSTTGGPTGGAGTSNPSRVYFSDAGAPEAWTSTNYIDLDPGDGEAIKNCITWREYVFVFKETKFYIFTEESTNPETGTVIFNYRKIDTGKGLAHHQLLTVDESGVYFVARDGIYVTTGEAPVKLSEPVDPVFIGGGEAYFADYGAPINWSGGDNFGMTIWNNLLLFSYDTGAAADRMLVYDTKQGWWSIWDVPANGLSTFRIDGTTEELVFCYAVGSNNIGRMNSTLTSDDGVAITSYWRGGYSDFGDPDIKRIRQGKAWGSGVITSYLNNDFKTADGTASTLTFDSGSGTLNPAFRRVSIRGTTFSLKFYNATLNQEWSVHRYAHHLAGTRGPSTTVYQNA